MTSIGFIMLRHVNNELTKKSSLYKKPDVTLNNKLIPPNNF